VSFEWGDDGFAFVYSIKGRVTSGSFELRVLSSEWGVWIVTQCFTVLFTELHGGLY